MKIRLDAALVELNLVTGRDRAKGLIMAGKVFVDNQKADKPGMPVNIEQNIEVRGETLAYVSRGGLKLEKALAVFPLDLEDTVCMDIGASTGGFTDCMLQNGAAKVFAIDVGYGQLAWKLRTHPSVVCLERTNIRHLTPEQVPDPIDFASVDVSFISLSLVLPVAFRFLREEGEMVCLIKPQFEAGREKVGKKGVVREPEIHQEVITKVIECAMGLGFAVKGLDFSPVKGPEGNIEYLIHLQKSTSPVAMEQSIIDDCVARAHTLLNIDTPKQ
ncbi:TlyA family RNA methyltransferase [Oscillospiraceae bacterium MB08-C2-2]|nr:TlyA family RNA methyltransferase [Oscillospiraceae bacterium MB08-C2-2]